MPANAQAVQFVYLHHDSDYPEYPDTNTIYLIENTKQLYVGRYLIADHIDVDLSMFKVKNVIQQGSGDYVQSVLLDETTGYITVTMGTLPTLGKGIDHDKPLQQLQPGDTFAAMSDLSVSGNTLTDENAHFQLPHQISEVKLEQGSTTGSVKVVVKTTDGSVSPATSEVQVFNPADYMAAVNGTAAQAHISLASAPLLDMDAANKKYVDDAVSSVASGTRFLGKSTTPITDGGTEQPTIDGQVVTDIHNGDIVLYGNNQFIWSSTSNTWIQSTDTSAYVTKDTQVIAGDGLTGGGQLNGNVTLGHDATGSGSAGSTTADTSQLEVIDSVAYDKFGHVTSVTKKSMAQDVQDAIDASVPKWNLIQ